MPVLHIGLYEEPLETDEADRYYYGDGARARDFAYSADTHTAAKTNPIILRRGEVTTYTLATDIDDDFRLGRPQAFHNLPLRQAAARWGGRDSIPDPAANFRPLHFGPAITAHEPQLVLSVNRHNVELREKTLFGGEGAGAARFGRLSLGHFTEADPESPVTSRYGPLGLLSIDWIRGWLGRTDLDA